MPTGGAYCTRRPTPATPATAAARRRWGECDLALGADGTPAVAEGAAAELGAALRSTTTAAMQLMADALNLRHRHPRVWARVEALEVPPWRARRLAQAAAHTSREAAREVDRRLAGVIGTCGTRRIETTIADVVARLDPDSCEETEQAAQAQWGVHLTHGTGSFYEGTSTLSVVGDTLGLSVFEDLVGAVAHQLLDPEVPGSGPGDLDQRRARALGVIADRAFAGAPVLDPAVPGSPGQGVPPAGRTHLYVHIDATDLTPDSVGPALGVVEGLGPVTLERIRGWLEASRATVLPVLHTDRADAVDAHDPPAWMRELVVLRDPTCVFPWCATGARRCDLDHIDPYDPHGPPGQTHPGNLAPLCRRHHRHKTHGRWAYARHRDGTYTWRSPTGAIYLVDQETTHALG